MSLNQTQISSLYVALFGRASEGAGNDAWVELSNKNPNLTMADVAKTMLDTPAAKEFFGNSLDSNKAFIYHIYKTTLNKDTDVDVEGKAGWIARLDSGIVDRAKVVEEILKAAVDPVHSHANDIITKEAHNLIINKILVSNIVSALVKDLPKQDLKSALSVFQSINNQITASLTQEQIKQIIESKKDVLKIDISKIDEAFKNNTKTKIVSNLTGLDEKDVQKQLEPNSKDNSKDDSSKTDSSNSNSSDSGNYDTNSNKKEDNSNSNPSSSVGDSSGANNSSSSDSSNGLKPSLPENSTVRTNKIEGVLNVMNKHASPIGFSAQIEHEGKKYFISIKSIDNSGLQTQLKTGEKIYIDKQGSIKRSLDNQNLKGDIYIVNEFPDDHTLDGPNKGIKILKAFTKDGHEFTPKDLNGIPYSHSFANAVYKDDGFFERPFSLVEGTTDGVYAQVVENGAKNIYKLVKDTQTTYYISYLPNSTSVVTTIIEDAKPGDKFKFHDGVSTLEKITNESELGINVKQVIKSGDDTVVYVGGSRTGFTNSDDLKIVFKNVKLDSLTATNGEFTLSKNIIVAGVNKISQDGFVKLFDNSPFVAIEGIDNVYTKDNKYYTDSEATVELAINSKDNDSGSLSIKAVKFESGELFTFRVAKTGQTKDMITAYTLDDLIAKGAKGDVLIISGITYTFGGYSANGKVAQISSDGFLFEQGSFGEISFDDAKTVTKEKFLQGILEGSFITNSATVIVDGVTYGLKKGGEIKSFTANFDKIKELLSSNLENKILNKAVTISEKSILNKENLDFIETKISKFADYSIKSLKLSIDDIVAINSALLSKIQRDSIEIIDNSSVLTKEQLKSLIPNSEKLKDQTIKSLQDLSVDEYYDIFGQRSYEPGKLKDSKISNETITLRDTAQKIEGILGSSVLTHSKIKSISLSNGNELSIDAARINDLIDKISDDVNINIKNANSVNKALILNDKVDTFEMPANMFGSFDILASEYDIFSAKLRGNGKFKIVDTPQNILEFLNKTNLDKVGGIKLKDKVIELNVEQFKKISEIKQFKVETDYGRDIKLKDSSTNLSATDYKVLKDFAASDIVSQSKKLIDIEGDETLELSKDVFDVLGLKFSPGDNLKITNTGGSIRATDANDTFVIGMSSNNLNITNFSSNDKIDFTGIDSSFTSIGNLNVSQTDALNIENGKIYKTDIASKSGFNFLSNLFGQDKAFAGIEVNAKAIAIVKIDSYIVKNQIYKINDADGSGTLSENEVELIGIIGLNTDTKDITASNIIIS